METRNITLNLPTELIRKAKVYAAEHETSVNGLVRDLLEDALRPENRAVTAAKRFLAIAERGPHFTIDPRSIKRDEIYERR